MVKDIFAKTLMDFNKDFKVIDYVKEYFIKEKDSDSSVGQQKEHMHPMINLLKLSAQDSNNTKIIQTLYHINRRPIFLDPDNQALNWLERQLAVDD